MRDEEIERRLRAVLTASGWFEGLGLEVEEGIAVLSGTTEEPARHAWATEVAARTEGVVAVANRIEVRQPLDLEWDLSPALREVRSLWGAAVRRSPLFVAGLLLAGGALALGQLVTRGSRPLLRRRFDNSILTQVAGTVISVAFVVLGLYLFLRVTGLTGLAATVLGGTGLFGLVMGIAFRDIAENFLASVLISAKRPFRPGDLIRLNGHEGYVQSVTTRGTLLVTAEGNHVHVPNSTVYKSTIENFTANPARRFEFTVGIDYEDPIELAQEVCLRVLWEHERVLEDPEPLVLVAELGASSVVLRALFWVDATRWNGMKVLSSVLRLTKAAVDEAGLTMPDDAREVIFPRGVPVRQVEDAPSEQTGQAERPKTLVPAARPVARGAGPRAETGAEGRSESEGELVERQAQRSAELDLGESLLDEGPPGPARAGGGTAAP